MRLRRRFESARQLSLFPAKPVIRRWLSVPTLTRLAVKPKACWARVAYLSSAHQRTGNEYLHFRVLHWPRSSSDLHMIGEKRTTAVGGRIRRSPLWTVRQM